MQSLKEVLSGWTGSNATADMVRSQIAERFGESAAATYNPRFSARTFNQWKKLGFRVCKGQTALKSLTYAVKKDDEGNIVKTFPKSVSLFHELQVEPFN